MQVSQGPSIPTFIMSAGLGTRMGEIGKDLPKVLWPIFEKSMLELQMDFARSLAHNEIFINTHYLADSVADFCRKLPGHRPTLLHESTLLGSGGGIHNLHKHLGQRAHGPLLILNADQFLFFPEHYWRQALSLLPQYHAILFTINVPPGQNYNRVVLQQRMLVDIIKSPESSDEYPTYSGVGLINLDKLEYNAGVSGFFDTVADYRKQRVLCIELDDYEYWDFGTTDRYFSSMFKVIETSGDTQNAFVSFLRHQRAFFPEKSNSIDRSYGSFPHCINLSSQTLENPNNNAAIILGATGPLTINETGIYYRNLFNGLSSR